MHILSIISVTVLQNVWGSTMEDLVVVGLYFVPTSHPCPPLCMYRLYGCKLPQVNATAVAVPRVIVAIMENYQNKVNLSKYLSGFSKVLYVCMYEFVFELRFKGIVWAY